MSPEWLPRSFGRAGHCLSINRSSPLGDTGEALRSQRNYSTIPLAANCGNIAPSRARVSSRVNSRNQSDRA